MCAGGGCRSHPTGTVAIPEVTVAQPSVQNVTDYLTFTGNTASADSVQLVARVEGYLEKLHFTDGALTRAHHEMIASYVSALNRCHY